MGNEYLINLGISSLLFLLQRVIPKDAVSKKFWKKALLKLFKAMAVQYADDPEFKI